MARFQRLGAITVGAAAIALLAACASPAYGPGGTTYPQGQPQGYPATQAPAGGAYAQYGSVTNVEFLRSQGQSQGVAGAVIGGVAGGLLGNQVGGGTGRTAATVAGVVGGALVGNTIERSATAGQAMDVYRVSVRLDNGSMQSFDYGQAPNVRIGDRVRVDGNQLYR